MNEKCLLAFNHPGAGDGAVGTNIAAPAADVPAATRTGNTEGCAGINADI